MSVRRTSGGAWSYQIKRVKEQIQSATGIGSANLSLDQLVKLADKQGFQIIISCVKVQS